MVLKGIAAGKQLKFSLQLAQQNKDQCIGEWLGERSWCFPCTAPQLLRGLSEGSHKSLSGEEPRERGRGDDFYFRDGPIKCLLRINRAWTIVIRTHSSPRPEFRKTDQRDISRRKSLRVCHLTRKLNFIKTFFRHK